MVMFIKYSQGIHVAYIQVRRICFMLGSRGGPHPPENENLSQICLGLSPLENCSGSANVFVPFSNMSKEKSTRARVPHILKKKNPD